MSALILFIIACTAIFLRIKSSFIGAWLLGWVIFLITTYLLVTLPATLQPSLLFVLLHGLMIVAAWLLLWGTHRYMGKHLSQVWIYSVLVTIGWMVLSNILQFPPSAYMFPGILLIAVIDIGNGIVWLKLPYEDSIGKFISGWALILLGLHHLDAPFLYMNSWIVPWGYLLVLCLSMLIILGNIQVYMESQQKEISASEERFRLLAENANDVVYRYRLAPTPGFEYVSPSVIHFNGFTPEEHYADPDLIYKSVHPDDQYMFSLLGKQLNNPKKIFWLRFVHKDGQVIWTEQRYEYTYDEHGTIIAVQGIIRDITERQQMEKQIEYVSIHDYLTNLYNRSFFEDKIAEFENYALVPMGVIMCDVDGLKLVNDSMGHDVGDYLLTSAASVLKNCSRPDDIVARIGGDEFAILMPESNETQTRETTDFIKRSIDNYNQENPQSFLSLSVGYAVKTDLSTNLQETLKNADHNMYRQKLYRSQSVRSTMVRTLTNTLHERDYITEGHSERLQDLVTRLGRSIDLSETRLAEMRLFAHFHDIGKVGIPDRILLKPGALSNDERYEMQKHCEIGYRLAQSGPELLPIADWILKHHEWWDGNGYPLGISGQEVPLECRILSIADAYDAMVSSRPYRQGMSPQEALAELNRCAGLQFDPYLVEKFIEFMQNDIVADNQTTSVS